MKSLKEKNKQQSDILSRRKQARAVWKALTKAYPDAHCALINSNPLQLLVATILSAQCTDKRVNMVTPPLFLRYPSAADFAAADLEELMKMIRSTGFYRNKAKNIKACCERIVKVFQGEVPDNMEDLITLAGVARKTANVVLFNAFGKNVGVVVDTHVWRTSLRLGLTEKNDPGKIEKDLMQIFPKKNWGMLGHYLVELGRDVCKAPTPHCHECALSGICPAAFTIKPKRRLKQL